MKTWLFLSSMILTAPAFADTQIYGTISSGISASQSRFADGTRSSSSKIEDYGSYIGMRGRIPLGNSGQTHTIWQWEQSSPTTHRTSSPSWRPAQTHHHGQHAAEITESR